MKNPAAVADILSASRYHDAWPLIPWDHLLASALDLLHLDSEGNQTSTKVLMHKRRVPASALTGDDQVNVCEQCLQAFQGQRPRLSEVCLANFNWLGRHEKMFQSASLGHQLLLPLGRVVSTKVYLSSKGVDEAARQQATTWRQRFLQSGMQGTAIVFSNGRTQEAMISFPPSTEVLQDTFVAVFTGPEMPSDSEKVLKQDSSAEARAVKDKMAKTALRKEVELQVDRKLFEEQASYLMATNYVYKDNATYRSDLVAQWDNSPAVPACFAACARFIETDADEQDLKQSSGPASATTAGADEADAAGAGDDTKWLSIVEEHADEVLEFSALPALQGLLERAEQQAGRVVANELMAVLEEGGYGASDELGRQRLQALCATWLALARLYYRDPHIFR